jgi:hypothetical protein
MIAMRKFFGVLAVLFGVWVAGTAAINLSSSGHNYRINFIGGLIVLIFAFNSFKRPLRKEKAFNTYEWIGALSSLVFCLYIIARIVITIQLTFALVNKGYFEHTWSFYYVPLSMLLVLCAGCIIYLLILLFGKKKEPEEPKDQPLDRMS